ncbi:hypothetical protein ACHAQH_007672 [Verticillium albo-atrum]
MNAVRAYFEWVPLRPADLDDNLRIWRNLSLGKLKDLTMLDTRHYNCSVTRVGWNGKYVYEISNDTGRSLMGSHQENWFFRQLSESKARGATWRVIGNQMIFSRMNMTADGPRRFDIPVDVDSWDGYLSTRNMTFQHIYDKGLSYIMLAGDSHQNWVSDLVWLGEHKYESVTGNGSFGVEFAVTAVSLDGLEGKTHEAESISRGFVEDNMELQWQEGYYRGYLELHVSHRKIDARFFGCATVQRRNAFHVPIANFTVFAGEYRLARAIAGGMVEAGALAKGEVRHTNISLDTQTVEWTVAAFDDMFIKWPEEWS